MQQCLHQMLAHHAFGNTHLHGDLDLALAIQEVQQEGLALFGAELFQDERDLLQGFERGENLLGRLVTRKAFDGQRQLTQVGVFDLFAA